MVRDAAHCQFRPPAEAVVRQQRCQILPPHIFADVVILMIERQPKDCLSRSLGSSRRCADDLRPPINDRLSSLPLDRRLRPAARASG
jgi:hypothetical protein